MSTEHALEAEQILQRDREQLLQDETFMNCSTAWELQELSNCKYGRLHSVVSCAMQFAMKIDTDDQLTRLMYMQSLAVPGQPRAVQSAHVIIASEHSPNARVYSGVL